MTRSLHLFTALLGTLIAGGAAAQTQAPGLWEHSFKTRSGGGDMERLQAQAQAQLAALPPEQRQQIEAMMKSRGVTIGAQGTSVQFCLTREQAARPPEPRLVDDCRQSEVQRSGNTMRYRFACTTPQQVSGEGEITYLNDKSYAGTGSVTTLLGGRPQATTMELSGRWLGAECGDIKPVTALPSR